MGYGKKLKELLDKKNMTVVELSKITNVNKNTLYTIIRNDSNIRFDFAFRIANALDIDVSEICQSDVFVTDETQPEMLKVRSEKQEDKLKKDWCKNRTAPIYSLFEYKQLPQIDKLLLDFFMLNDTGRTDLRKYLDFQLSQNTSKERKQETKKIIK